jgi:hypothetical protein
VNVKINLPDSVKAYLRIPLVRSIEMIQNTQLRVWIQVLASTRAVVGCLVQAKTELNLSVKIPLAYEKKSSNIILTYDFLGNHQFFKRCRFSKYDIAEK